MAPWSGLTGIPAGFLDDIDNDTTYTADESSLTLTGTTFSILNGGVTSAHIAADAVTASQIGTDAVGSDEIAANAVGSSEIAAGAVGSTEIGAGAVLGSNIAANNVTSTHIAANAVTTSEIADGTITALDIANDTITSVQIGPGAVGSSEILDGTIAAADIAAGAVGTTELAADAVLTGNILDGTITGADIATGTVASIDITDATIVAADIAADAVTTSEILDGTIASVDILDGTIASTDILDGTIASADILDGTIASTDIAADAVTTSEILDGTIASVDILDGTIASTDILDGTIASTDIADGTITSADVATNTFWELDGNAGTTPGTDFVGTTDDVDLELHVNGVAALRIESNAASTPNLIAGFSGNVVTSTAVGATIGGGGANTLDHLITDDFGTVVGGADNQAGDDDAIISNDANFATVVGGFKNTASGKASSVLGGRDNTAAGDYSVAMGRLVNIDAAHDGTFVFADSSLFAFNSTSTNQFAVRAIGGADFWTAIDGSGNQLAGVHLPAGGGQWLDFSDVNSKANVVNVDGLDILERLKDMPVSTWNYKTQDDAIRHIGPMAQDFYAAFQVGEDSRRIGTIDSSGVALAAIQGLSQLVDEKDAQIAALEERLDALEQANGASSWPLTFTWATNLLLIGVGGLIFGGLALRRRYRRAGQQ